MSLARLQHEVEELRRRIEELKMKLTVEMKVSETDAFLFCFWEFCFLFILDEERFKNSDVNKMQRPLIMIARSEKVAPRR